MIITRVVPIPDGGVRAFTVKDKDENYNIYLNASLSDEMQKEAFQHELEHIRRGDFDSGVDVQVIETETH